MLLAIDIGNSNTVVGVFDNGKLNDYFRVTSNLSFTIDECGFFITGLLDKMKITPENINRVVIASVVPRLTSIYADMTRRYFSLNPLIVSSGIKLPIRIDYSDPTEVGADRIANAAAAFKKYQSAVIVVDFGTATTFDVIDDNGIYQGGVICPGVETSSANLAARAAKLFDVNVDKPDRVIGKTTVDSLKSGLFYGTVGQVDTILELIIDEINKQPKVIATGGLAAQFTDSSKFIESSEPTLTLEGLKIIADFNDNR